MKMPHCMSLKGRHHNIAAMLWIILICCFSSFVQAASQPLLWKVEDQRSQVRLYLFGSLHYGDKKFYPLPDTVLNAYQASDALAVELDIDALKAEQIHITLQRYGYYSDGKNLPAAAGVQLWQKIKDISSSLGIDAQQLTPFQPWLAAMQLTSLQLARSNYQPSLGVDKYFLSAARGKKNILELETLDEQMQLFSQLSESEQLEFLQITLKEHGTTEDSLNTLAEAWYRGDEKTLDEAVFSAFHERPLGKKLYQMIFVERNKQMVQTVEKYLKNIQQIFLVVGIGHMLGDDGLIALLEEKGYTVTRISPVLDD
jgi:Uncharacterized protein conserved in bacteria